MLATQFINGKSSQNLGYLERRNAKEITLNAAPIWLSSLLNDVGFGVLILDPQLRISFSNEDAKLTMRAIGIEGLVIGSTFTTDSRENQNGSYTNKFIANARLAGKGQRKLVIFGDRDSQIAIAMSPITLGTNASEFGVMVTMERKRVCETLSLWAYGKVQGLTPGEIKVLQHLAEGRDPTSVAQTLKISVSTVRTHIRSMVNKTDSSCMRSLLMKVAKLPPISSLNGLAL